MNVEYMKLALQLGTLYWKRYALGVMALQGSHHATKYNKGPATIVRAYAPTLAASTEGKDEYGKRSATIESVSKSEQTFLLGDWNARIGDDSTSWPANIGSFGIEKMNKNGQRLVEFRSYYDLVVTNSGDLHWRTLHTLVLTTVLTVTQIIPLYVASSSYKLSIFTKLSSLETHGLTLEKCQNQFLLNSLIIHWWKSLEVPSQKSLHWGNGINFVIPSIAWL